MPAKPIALEDLKVRLLLVSGLETCMEGCTNGGRQGQ